MKAILGIKKGMTRVFEDDKSVPVTVVDVSGCRVARIDEKDGNIVLGLGSRKNAKKALEGQYKDLGFVPKYTWIVKGKLIEGLKVGSDLVAETFNKGDKIVISGVSKGKGFAGVVKRHGFKGGPRTHGQSDRQRAPGSIGAGTDPGRVFKGKKMPGRMGSDKVTIKNKKIIDIKDNYILVSGPIPGSNGDLVKIYIEE